MISHLLAFLSGAFAMLAAMILDAVLGPFTLRRKPRVDPEEPYMDAVQ